MARPVKHGEPLKRIAVALAPSEIAAIDAEPGPATYGRNDKIRELLSEALKRRAWRSEDPDA
ncbi:MAG: hypothetical protein EBR82_11360 [Caulobacteraceae bacterium]|nr:hypothetical protein [Caulobacteraceae bacterium]